MAINQVKRILVPVNFDQVSEKLLKYAGQLAKAFGAELLLVHTTQVPELTFTQQSRLIQTLRSFGERVLLRQHEAGTGFTRFECLVRPDTLRKSIKAIVQDYFVDLVLMEASPAPTDEQLRANHASAVIEVLECPVITIPLNVPFQKLKHLVFATDFTDHDVQVLRRIADFANQAGAGLTLVQVYSSAERSHRSRIKAAMREVQELLSAYTLSYKLLEEEDMLEGISDFAGHEEADMLILATQDNYLMERLFSNAYVKTMAYHTQIPLVTFRQLKTKPCSGCCANCKNKQDNQQDMQKELILLK
ncbi:universal stress protein [Pontibacter sp. KCTC 32443]|uniref:universal stress protein n=1 Tax=Pontibacter TaxID=323449 RepID=UPI00164E997F|nr:MULTISPECIES: universal stress protein [Pontibacter]MBC5773520.1 universal stress protein [Pontibacter sp. KCTC 32443]